MVGASRLFAIAGGICLAAADDHFGFDCESGYEHWVSAWTKEKKDWCCSYVQRGCGDGARIQEETFDCFDDPNNNFKNAWSARKKDWCCQESMRWSNAHQPFCCDRGVGCNSDARTGGRARGRTADSAVCDNIETASIERKNRCCKQNPNHPGCVDKYNCNIGAQALWGRKKQEWCCRNKDKGCKVQDDTIFRKNGDLLPTRTTVDLDFDCKVCSNDYDNHRNWNKDKVCDCCHFCAVACPNVYYPPAIPEDGLIVCNKRGDERRGARRVWNIARKAARSAPWYSKNFDDSHGAQEKAPEASKVATPSSKLAAVGAVVMILGALSTMALRRTVKGAAGPFRGYAPMSGEAGKENLVQEEATGDLELS